VSIKVPVPETPEVRSACDLMIKIKCYICVRCGASYGKIDPQLPAYVPIIVACTMDYASFQSTKSCHSTEPAKKGVCAREEGFYDFLGS